MGVSGSGKSTVGRGLATAAGLPFAEGDDLHSAENVAKMRAGIPLTDADRAPWLAAVAAWIGRHQAAGGVISCSALRRAYRDRLRDGHPSVRFVCLTAAPDVLAERMAHRPGHYMPPSLLASQLATFEPLEADEPGVTLDAGRPLADLVAEALTD